MYNDKGNTKYLKLLKQNYSSSQDVIREIVNLSAIINLPKGTEFFLSDIHGEYEAFQHVLKNAELRNLFLRFGGDPEQLLRCDKGKGGFDFQGYDF